MNDYGQSPSKKKKDTDRLSPNNELVVVFFFHTGKFSSQRIAIVDVNRMKC